MASHTTLDRLAQAQGGIVTRRQLLAAGLSGSGIDRALGAGALIPVARGVYRSSGAPWTRRGAQHAALLAVGGEAVLSHWTAAEIHRMSDPRPGPVHVLAAHARSTPAHCAHLLRLHRTRSLPAQERCVVNGLAVTSGPRTVLDLACVATTAHLAELIAAGVRVGACTLQGMGRVVDAHLNARGRARLRGALQLLADDGGRARSDVEIDALRVLMEAGLPRPVVAHRVVDEQGRFVAEVDLAYPDLRVAIEIDGFRWHSSPERKRRDEQRQNRLVLAGWIVLRFSASEVRARPERLVSAVRRALRTR
jgi:hypothetical protein